jgi:hypothetical protein
MSVEENLDLSARRDWQSMIADLSPERLKKIQALNLRNCKIQELPAELSAMSNLETLDSVICISFQHQLVLGSRN